MTQGPIDLLSAGAAGHGIVIAEQSSAELEADVPAPLPDGQIPVFKIRIKVSGSDVSAYEVVPAKLPSFCPERHINPDGSFCLGWSEAEDLRVTDDETAWLFWAKLIKFLRMQVRAERLKRWPDDEAWAHGDAARHQRKALAAATALSPALAQAVRRGKLRVERRSKGGRAALRVFVAGSWLYSVWTDDWKVVNQRSRCICTWPERGSRIVAECPTNRKNHEDYRSHRRHASDLALTLAAWESAEAAFWKSLNGKPCCNTMTHCPLK